jgi:3,4-dihydroxy-2-butanone 4-phosphate synthase
VATAVQKPDGVPIAFATVEEAIEDIRAGRMVVVVDAADRENEGDLTIAAQFATPEAIAFMAKQGCGLICLCLSGERCDALGLRQMTERNQAPHGTAFTVSIEAREGISTGISAHDRSRTIQVAIDTERGRAARARVPVACETRRRPRARGPDRGRRRSRQARRAQRGWCDL